MEHVGSCGCKSVIIGNQANNRNKRCYLYHETTFGQPAADEQKWTVHGNPIIASVMPCSTGFSRFGTPSGCYRFAAGGWTGTWPQARNKCQTYGSDVHLAGKESMSILRILCSFGRYDHGVAQVVSTVQYMNGHD